MKKRILFITGTRADYGKMKSLIKAVEKDEKFEALIFVSGMHLLEKYGSTYREVLKDDYVNTYIDFTQANQGNMSYDLGNVICNLTGYVNHVKPDMMVVHGDRIDALAGAVVGAMNNIRVAHIEGGELSGTIDESTRHAITKFAHLHLVCNDEAKQRLLQLGEESDRIYIIGSPDLDLMLSKDLPTIDEVKQRYDIPYEKYAILMYHPVTTERKQLHIKVKKLVDSIIESKGNFIVIYPNNDHGSDIILDEYRRFECMDNIKIYPSIRFECFLTLMKNAQFMIGNSSAGVRETGYYGIPAIDIGSRQKGRYSKKEKNVQHVEENVTQVLHAIKKIDDFKFESRSFGNGKSTEIFLKLLHSEEIWNLDIQKKFVDFSRGIGE